MDPSDSEITNRLQMSDMEFMESLLPSEGDNPAQKATQFINFLLVSPAELTTDNKGTPKATRPCWTVQLKLNM